MYEINVFFRCPSSNKSHYVSAWNERGGFAHTQTYTWGRGSTNSLREEFIELSCSFHHWKWDRWLKTDTLKLQVTEKQNSCESECVYWSICCQPLFKLFLRLSMLQTFWHYNRMILLQKRIWNEIFWNLKNTNSPALFFVWAIRDE